MVEGLRTGYPTECPICGSRTDFFDYLEHAGNRWVRCARCGGGHRIPYVPEIEDPTYTEKQYDETFLTPAFYQRRYAFAADQAEWLARNFRAGMTIIEIGPGLGLAADRFLDRFPGTPYHVIETHRWFSDYIAKRLGSRVRIHEQQAAFALDNVLREASAGARTVLLYMDNVLEHIAEPRKLMLELKAKLPSGSIALVDVPNEHGLKWRHIVYTAIGGQTTVTRGHINLFTIKALDVMFSGLGLSHRIKQRGIRRPEEVNCLPRGPALTFVLTLLRWIPIDTMLELGNNLRAEIEFP